MSWAWRSTMKFSKFVEFADAAQLPMNDQVSFDADDFFYKLKELTEQFSNDQIAELIPVDLSHEPDVWLGNMTISQIGKGVEIKKENNDAHQGYSVSLFS